MILPVVEPVDIVVEVVDKIVGVGTVVEDMVRRLESRSSAVVRGSLAVVTDTAGCWCMRSRGEGKVMHLIMYSASQQTGQDSRARAFSEPIAKR